jgi:hypothetical protein
MRNGCGSIPLFHLFDARPVPAKSRGVVFFPRQRRADRAPKKFAFFRFPRSRRLQGSPIYPMLMQPSNDARPSKETAMTIGSRAGKQPRNSRHSPRRRTQGKFIDISICPTQLESGDDVRDGDLVVAAVRGFAERQYPGARVSVQIGFRQGHEWATVCNSADFGRSLMDGFWESHADDEALFVGGAA